MKKLPVLFIGLLLTVAATGNAKATSIGLSEAIQKHMVKAVFNGRGSTTDNLSSHFGRCISLKLQNLTRESLTIRLEAGRRLKCSFDSVQDMLISENEIFALAPGASKDYTINAFCSEKSNHSPSESSKFLLAGMADGYLYELIVLIQSLRSFNSTGQSAVWVLTDNSPVENITGKDTAVVNKLRKFVSFALGRNSQRKEGVIYDYSYPEVTDSLYTISGSINWTMPWESPATFSIYDNYGKKVYDVFVNVIYRQGFQYYNYKITDPIFKEDRLYWLRIEGCGRRLKEVAVTMKP